MAYIFFLILRKDQKKERYDIIDCSLKLVKKAIVGFCCGANKTPEPFMLTTSKISEQII